MTDTSTRPLPTDHGLLKLYLPPEPTDTTVAAIRDAVRRLDEASAEVRADLDKIETVDRSVVNALVDAAIHDDHLGVLIARLDPGRRLELTHRYEQLQAARTVATHRLTIAERTDPAMVRWREQTEQVRREWQMAMDAETSEQRFAGLAAFAQRH